MLRSTSVRRAIWGVTGGLVVLYAVSFCGALYKAGNAIVPALPSLARRDAQTQPAPAGSRVVLGGRAVGRITEIAGFRSSDGRPDSTMLYLADLDRRALRSVMPDSEWVGVTAPVVDWQVPITIELVRKHVAPPSREWGKLFVRSPSATFVVHYSVPLGR